MSFENLNLHATLIRAVADAGYTQATDVQLQAIPAALAGRDLMVSSNTGSGKTASFVLPALMKVMAARDARAAAEKAEKAERATPAVNPPGQALPRGPRPANLSSGPRVLVLTPTRELALQVSKAVSDYGRHVPG
ncbi:MAG: DEAD/DEAH box helicase, partial [Rhizobacter sp.]|nr:DEAD/DEAH box helicase [Rhizobacter sp.]